MPTFLQDLSDSMEEKWNEIDTLIEVSKCERDENEALYNAMCRSITILIVSHLEGFMKNLVKSVIRDINENMCFSELPEVIRYTYCKNYIPINIGESEKSHYTKLKKLSEKFSDIECVISHEPFLFYEKNKNPNKSVITSVFSNFGFKNIFHYIHNSDIDEVFSESLSGITSIKEKLRSDIHTLTEDFPYSLNDTFDKYNFKKQKINSQTLWEDFIVETNQNRHAIAHGNNFNNTDDVHSLELRKEKTLVFQYSLIALLGSKLSISC